VDFRRCLPLTSRKQANQYLLRRFTGQASRDGNVSGNIHADPPTSMKSSDPVFKPFSDMRGSQWTRLGITGVRLPSPPAFARLTPELRLARQPKANQAECRVCSSRAKAVRHSSASSERRRTVLVWRPKFTIETAKSDESRAPTVPQSDPFREFVLGIAPAICSLFPPTLALADQEHS
jgi:hypothetical protein